MDLYQKIEKVIKEHIEEHQSEVRKGKELLSKLDVIHCNAPTEDYSFDLAAIERHSSYYYDWDRNGKTVNPFTETPDYTEL